MSGFLIRQIIACAFALLLILPAACTRDQQHSTPPAIERHAKMGPVECTVRFSPSEISVGETATLILDVLAEPGVLVKMPTIEAGEETGGFEITSATTPPDVPDGSKRRFVHTYTLRTFEPGEHEFPSFEIAFKSAEASDQSTLLVEPLVVQVQSSLPAGADIAEFRDIKEAATISTPWSLRTKLITAVGVVIVLISLILVVLAMRRRSKAVAVPPLPPHIWAIQQLDALALERLLERGEFHEFFFRLSGIVRQYIERRFNIMAAEQTTEEFLRAMRHNSTLHEAHRSLLADFLREADMVKFARFQPTRDQGDSAFESARRFVDETALRDDAKSEPSFAPRPHAQSKVRAEVGV